MTAFNLNGTTETDGSGNAANSSLTGLTQTGPQIETTPPTVASVSAAAGSDDAGTTLTLTLDLSEQVTVNGTPRLNDDGTATYASGFGSGTLAISIPTPQWVTTQSAVPDDTLPALSQVTVNPAGDAIANQKFSDSTHDLNGGPIFVNKVEQVPGAIIDMPASRAGEADPPAGVLNAMEQVPETPTGAPSTIDTSATITIANGASIEIQGASAQSVAFAGTTGTLKLENAVGFTGQISGLTGSDALDLADVPYGTKTTATFSGNANGGTLTVTDGNHTAQIALLGDYLGSGWTVSSDGNGGTVVVDPSLYPNASNTGVSAGVKLTPYSGNLTITTAGEVVSGLIISNGVQIAASNVTLENCIIEVSPTAPWDIGVSGGLTGVVIQNCEIVGAGTAGPQGSMGIYVQGNSQVTINAVNMHDVGQGVDVNDGQVILENSYIHNLNAGAGTHYEDVGYFGAAKSGNFSFLIQDNTLINQQNQAASVFLQNYFGAVNNVTVNNNILTGGDYTVYMDASGDGGPGTGTPVTNVSFTNNHMGTGIFGYTDFIHWTNPVYTGNINDGQTLISVMAIQAIQSDYLAIVRTTLPLDQATMEANTINAGTTTETQYIISLLSQVANTTIPAVAVEGSMYGAVGTSEEITNLATQILPAQVAFAVQHGFNPQVVATEALGLVFAFGNETGSTAFANNFGPSNPATPNSVAGDAAFATAAAGAIFGSASTTDLINAIDGYVTNWKAFYASSGIPGNANPSAIQIDLAARGAAWGDAVGVALATDLGPLNGQAIDFLQDAAQGTAVYSASLSSQPNYSPFQGSASSASAALTDPNVQLTGVAPHLDHTLI